MIIRSAIECDTCGSVFIVRIGMGQGVQQEHTVSCKECKEPMSFGMAIDYKALSTRVFEIDGCKIVSTSGNESRPILNVDANFAIPESMTSEEFSFHRHTQLRDMFKAAERFGPIQTRRFDPKKSPQPDADYLDEWKKLKKAVSLSSNGKKGLSEKKVSDASREYYSDDVLAGVTDWFFRFSLKFLGRKYYSHFESVAKELDNISKTQNTEDFVQFYKQSMFDKRFQRYKGIYTDFFSKYSQFAQVLFQAKLDLPPSKDMVATSVQFDQVKSFYGDAFEVFAGSVDFFAMLNNIKCGRKFDEFEKMNLDKYVKLDNASKFNPFADNPIFFGLCEECDNQIRNASHHRDIKIDYDGKSVRYRAGKGGTGPEQELTYASYLYRSSSLFLQICVLASVEMVFCSANGIELPFD